MTKDPVEESNLIDTTRHLEKNLHAFYESTKSIRFFLSVDHTVLFFNKKALEQMLPLFGKKIKAGITISKLLKKSDLREDFILLFKKSLNGDHITSEYLIGPSDHQVWYKIDYHSVMYDLKTIGSSISIRNINDRKRKESIIQHQNDMLQDIIFNQSHIVRAPVANILGLIDLLDKSKLSKKNKEVVHYLEVSAKNLDDIIKKTIDTAYDSKIKVI
ncbi:hypothetical protein ACM55K_13245 [Flavobacterium sp. LT1R49]|uniref:hypothetical protein n=1 Tax=Flavobacterium arabinosi TaxID=3398737 RepID=UPI003A87BE68